MSLSVVLEAGEVFTALGTLETTVEALFHGHSGVNVHPCFGVPVPWAPFADESLRDIFVCTQRLAARLTLPRSDDILLVFCAAKGDIRRLDYESSGKDPTGLPSALLSSQAEIVSSALGCRFSRVVVISNACASGTIALDIAAELLREGVFTHAVIVGYDSVSRFVATGFQALGALSSSPARPFDKHRSGLSLGDGAAAVVLSYRKPSRGDICIAGAGSSNDANHRTGPSRTGDGLVRAARAALEEAHLEPAQIGGVKCHGTATLYNDAMEAKALYTLFGARIPPCVSVKGALGHTSGGGSLLEVILAARFLSLRRVPPTVGFSELGVEEPVPISVSEQALLAPSILCLSAGFGGVNAAAVLTETP